MRQYMNKHRLLPVLRRPTLSLSTCFENMHVSPHDYTLPWTVLCVTCLVCACLNRWVHTHACQASPEFIHSFKHSLAVKLCFLTFKYSSILIMGVYTLYVSR